MESVSNVLIVAIIFAAIYGVIRLLIQRKERLIMIEKGNNMPEIENVKFAFSSIKLGLFFMGIGLGVLAANILIALTTVEVEAAYFSMVLLLGGIALIIAHLVERKKDK